MTYAFKLYFYKYEKKEKQERRKTIMAKDFDLDVQALTTQEGDSKEPRIKSVALCTPGCVPTATLCTSCIFACVD